MISGTRYFHILNIAIEAVIANKVRSILTALGIIFGVAAVIAMMAIGNGAKKEILDQMKLIGVNNIIITPLSEKTQKKESEAEKGKQMKKAFSAGISMKDAAAIKLIVPTAVKVSPEVKYETMAIYEGKSQTVNLSGVTPDYFDVFNLPLENGTMFRLQDMTFGNPVCIIGHDVKAKFFPQIDPIGQTIKCGSLWLKIIGVLQNREVSDNSAQSLGISNYNTQVYAPIQTIFLRVKDRSVITSKAVSGSGSSFFGGDFVMFSSSSGESKTEFNQLDKIIVQVNDSKLLNVTSEVIKRMLLRKHNSVEDFEVKVPELLLKQEQRTKDIFNIVLFAIASISLLVGGIGIMNIMLASVLERIKEIGVRLAIGARRKDIILQFLTEATLISVTGGLIGIILGVVFAKTITRFADILTIISPLSIFISFGVSAAVGILFGYMPAKKAAQQDPVTSLRYE
jgi:putative ABC transport system permease protein